MHMTEPSKTIRLSAYRSADDDSLLNNNVTLEEVFELESELIKMYALEARRQRKTINLYTNPGTYEDLRSNGKLFDPHLFYLLVDHIHNVLDMSPIVYRFMDTALGRRYAKIMQQRECRQP